MGHTFKPCINRNACRDDGERCLVCGRSLQEIAKTKSVVDSVHAFLQEMAYDNPAEFMDYLGRKIAKKMAHSAKP
jgi:hypothetical protein